MSSLNPHAASYVPISKRGTEGRMSKVTPTEVKSADKSEQIQLQGPRDDASHNIGVHGSREPLSSQVSYSHGSWPQNPNYVTEDEDHEMDLAYLASMFPGISDPCLAEVLFTNVGNLEASIDMLNLMEFTIAEESANLPDTLDIGDVNFGSSSGEASGSSSGAQRSLLQKIMIMFQTASTSKMRVNSRSHLKAL